MVDYDIPRVTQPPRFVPRYGQYIAKVRTNTDQFRVVFLEVVQQIHPLVRVWYPVVLRIHVSGRHVTVEDWGLVHVNAGEQGGYLDQGKALIDALLVIHRRLQQGTPPDRVLVEDTAATSATPIRRVVRAYPYRTLIDGLRRGERPQRLSAG